MKKQRLVFLLPMGLLTTCSSAHGSPTSVPVEIWTGGDDGLTQRLRVAVEHEFRASPRFVMFPANAADHPLRVTIPTHVRQEGVGTHTRVRYQLELSRDGRMLKSKEGTCREVELVRCARQILHAAEAVAGR